MSAQNYVHKTLAVGSQLPGKGDASVNDNDVVVQIKTNGPTRRWGRCFYRVTALAADYGMTRSKIAVIVAGANNAYVQVTEPVVG